MSIAAGRKKPFIGGLAGGLILGAIFAGVSLSTKGEDEIVPLPVPENKAYCLQTGVRSFSVYNTAYSAEPFLTLQNGELRKGGKEIAGYAQAPGVTGVHPYFVASPVDGTCKIETFEHNQTNTTTFKLK